MKTCLLLALSLLPASAIAQIQVFEYNGTTETPVGGLYNVGSATPGDTLETRFRVKNTGTGPATFQTLSLAGTGFQIAAAPSLPYIIAPGSEVEFDTNFSPTTIGTYSAFLIVNTLNITLQGNGVQSAVLTLAGSKTPLAAGATINFGSVTSGSSTLQGFTLSNPESSTLTVQSIAVSGTGFSGPIGLIAPVQLAPGLTASFQVSFQPQNGQSATGSLTIDGRSFNLTGQGLNTPLPTASITLASTVGASAQQNSLSIPLASASQVSGSGTLAMKFIPSVAGVTDDPTVQFLSGPPRIATVTVSVGDSIAKFNGQSSIAFQTGATAGTIAFTLTLPNGTLQASLNIAPVPITLDTASGLRKAGELDVSLTGLDNTYSASNLSFTFYNLTGAVVQPGAIGFSAGTIFQQYFATTQVGGSFALLATFPVTGDTTQIGSVTLQITNSAGTTTAQNIQIAGSTPPQPIPQ
jgi:centrosomal CEP192-like protein/HYDIN/CFA65/VesB family protein